MSIGGITVIAGGGTGIATAVGSNSNTAPTGRRISIAATPFLRLPEAIRPEQNAFSLIGKGATVLKRSVQFLQAALACGIMVILIFSIPFLMAATPIHFDISFVTPRYF